MAVEDDMGLHSAGHWLMKDVHKEPNRCGCANTDPATADNLPATCSCNIIFMALEESKKNTDPLTAVSTFYDDDVSWM